MFNVETKTTKDDVKMDKAQKIVNIVAIVVCVLLIPILLFNCILIVKGIVNPDEVPSIFGYIPLIVETGSMEDAIMEDDLIVCKTVDTDTLKVGDVITFFDPDSNGKSVVTHRIIDIFVDAKTGDVSYRTKGDDNNIEDRLLVPEENVIGIWTGIHIWQLGGFLLFTQSIPGILILVILPIGAFIVWEYLKKKKQTDAKQSDIDALRAELEAMKAERMQNAGSVAQKDESTADADETKAEEPAEN